MKRPLTRLAAARQARFPRAGTGVDSEPVLSSSLPIGSAHPTSGRSHRWWIWLAGAGLLLWILLRSTPDGGRRRATGSGVPRMKSSELSSNSQRNDVLSDSVSSKREDFVPPTRVEDHELASAALETVGGPESTAETTRYAMETDSVLVKQTDFPAPSRVEPVESIVPTDLPHPPPPALSGRPVFYFPDAPLREDYVLSGMPEEEWNTLVDPAFRDTPKLYVDADFHRFRDEWMDLDYTREEMLWIFERVVRIWAQANVHVRFWLPESLSARELMPGVSEAYRLYVTGEKNASRPEMASQRAVLAKTAFGKARAEWLYHHFSTVNLVNPRAVERALVNSHTRTPWVRRNIVSIYSMYYYRWYNGLSVEGMILIRGGSCFGPNPRVDPATNRPVMCRLGFQDGVGPRGGGDAYDASIYNGARIWERFPHTWRHFSRVLAHEIGHHFGLPHFNGLQNCTRFETMEEANLMSQQRAIAVRSMNTTCSETNELGSEATRLTRLQMQVSRRRVAGMETYHALRRGRTRVGAALEEIPPAEKASETATRFDAAVFPDLLSPCDGVVERISMRVLPRVLATSANASGTPIELIVFALSKPASSVKLGATTALDALRVPLPVVPSRRVDLPVRFRVQRGQAFGVISTGAPFQFDRRVASTSSTLPRGELKLARPRLGGAELSVEWTQTWPKSPRASWGRPEPSPAEDGIRLEAKDAKRFNLMGKTSEREAALALNPNRWLPALAFDVLCDSA